MTRAALCLALTALLTTIAAAATVYVPADEPTIQAGIDAAGDGGTVYVASGVYGGDGNRELDFAGMNVTLESTGGPASTVIDCEGAAKAFYFHTGEDTTCVVEGFTIRNCSSDYGGAMRIQGASPTIRYCIFSSNAVSSGGGAVHANSTSTQYGAGVYSLDAESTFERCTFIGNEASYGGGVYLQSDYNPPHFTRCTFADNEGGGIWCKDAYPVIAQTILAFDRTRAGIYCSGTGVPSITHSFIFGNAAGDSLCGSYVNNRFEDPLFCDMQYGDVQLCDNSLCLPVLNPWGVHVGAKHAGCPDCDSPVDITSWGAVKALYRQSQGRCSKH